MMREYEGADLKETYCGCVKANRRSSLVYLGIPEVAATE
jgi:hypothetical protein